MRNILKAAILTATCLFLVATIAIGQTVSQVTVTGRVTDPDGKPVKGASVSLRGATPQQAGGLAQTDSTGGYKLSIAPGTYTLTVTPPVGTPFLSVQRGNVSFTANQTLDFKLERGVVLSGTIKDPDGKPVKGANVTLSAQGMFYGMQSRDDGRYSIVARAGTYSLSVNPPPGTSLLGISRSDFGIRADATQDFSLQRGVTVSGKVTDADGKPVRGVSIGLQGAGALTDSTGAFRVSVRPGTYDISISPPRGTPFLSERRTSVDVKGDLALNISLKKGIQVSGVVRDPDGKRIQGAFINLNDPKTKQNYGSSTDADGAYSVVVPLAAYTLRVSPPQNNPLLPLSREGLEVTADLRLDFTLEKGKVLSGKVTDLDGKPAQSAYVTAYNLKTQLSAGSSVDAQGQYRVTLSAGTYNINVRPPAGGALSPRDVKDYQVTSDQTLDIKLDRGAVLTGRVTDLDGKPVRGANVSVWSPELNAGGGAQTDSIGGYRISVRPGAYNVSVRPLKDSPLIPRDIQNYQVKGDQTLDIRLEKGAALTGRVTRPDGKPVQNVSVSLYSQQLKTSGGAQTDADGGYRIILTPGVYSLSVRVPAGGSFVAPRDVKEYKLAGDQTYDVKLEQGKVLSGRVADPEGKPVVLATVNLYSQQLTLSTGAQTDSTGRYRIVLPSSSYDVTVNPPQGGALLSARAEKTNVFANLTLDFKLERGAVLSGLVSGPDKQGIADANVSAYDPRTKTSGGIHTGKDGRYTLILKKGEYDVTVSPPSPSRLIGKRLTGVKVEGESRLDIPLDSGVLMSGRVTDADGKSVPRASVYASNPQGGVGAQTDSTGQYRLTLPPGVYRISVTPPSGAALTAQTRDNVEAFKDLTLDVRLQTGLVLSGTITNGSGEPVENVPVSVYSRQLAFGAGAKSDTAGAYRLVLKPGIYDVTVNPDQKTSLTRQTLSGVEVKADRQLDITLKSGLTLSGRVVGPKGGGIQRVSVTAQDDNVANGPEDSETTDRDGAFALTLVSGVYQISLRPPADTRFLPQTLSNVEVKTDRKGFEIKLDEGLILTGRVTDPDGKPVREASVGVSSQSEKFSAGAATDPDGAYKLILKPGVYYLNVSPPRTSAETSSLIPRALSNVRVTENAALNLVLDRGVFLSGRITDRGGHPLPEVSIGVSTKQAYSAGTQTDADGRYRFPLRPDTYIVSVTPRPTTVYLPRRMEGVELKAARTLDAVLDEGLVLSGKVTDAGGDPVEGAYVRANDQDKTDGEDGAARTGPDGAYRTLLASGVYDIDVVPPDGNGLLRATTSGLNLTAHRTLDFKLTKGLALSGHAARADGLPLPDVRVSAFNPQTSEGFSATTRKDGSYAITLPPGVYQVRAEPPSGSEFIVKEIKDLDLKISQKLDLTFDRGSVLSGKVTDPDGKPVPNVSVGASGSGGNFGAVTRADGTYTLTLPPGAYNLGFYPRTASDLIPSSLPGVQVKGDQKLDARLERGFLLSGKITDAKGNPVKQVSVRADDGKGGGGGGSADQDGRYRLPLKPGTYKVTFDPFGSKLTRKVVDGVEVKAARTLDIALDEGAALSGKVTDPAGDGAEDISVNVYQEGRYVRGAQTFLDGTYSLALPPGTYTLTFDPKPGSPLVRQTQKDVKLDADRRLDVTLAAGVLLSGRVTGPTGAGVARAGVSVRNNATEDTYGTGTDADGNYRQTLPPGAYAVTVGPPPTSRLAVRQVKDVRITANRSLDVQLDNLTGLSGRVLDPDKKPVPFARVSAESGGKGQGSAGADEKGAYSLILTPGVYTVIVYPPSRSALRRTRLDSVRVSSDQTLDLSLARGVGLSGRVTDAAGKGLEKVSVSLYNTSSKEWVGTSTASDGTYGLGLEAGTYDVNVTPSDPASRFIGKRLPGVEVKADRTLDVRLDQGALISGRVTDAAGNPIPRVSVNARDTSGTVYGRSTDEKGSYVFALPAGAYTMEAYPPAGAPFMPRRTAGVKVSGDFRFEITLDKGVALKGRVADPDSAGVDRTSVRAFKPETGESYGAGTDMEGRYAFALPPGTYRVEVRPPEGRSLLRKDLTNVPVTADRTLDIALDRGAILSGRIVTPAGDRGMPGVEMIFIQRGKGQAGEAITNSEGFYKVALPLGLYLVAYTPPPLKGYLPAFVDSVGVDQARTLDLKLEEGTALIGRVLGAGDTPVSGAILTATGRKGDRFSSITTSDGLFRLLLPAGVYDLDVQPSANTGLAAQKVPSVDAGAGKPLEVKLTAATGPTAPARAVKIASSASTLPADGASALTLTVTVTQPDGALSTADDSTTVVFSLEGPAEIKPGRVRVKGGVGSAQVSATTVAGKIEIVAAAAGLAAGKAALASFPAGADADSLVITTGPVVADIAATSAAVIWSTDRASDGAVEFGTTPSFGATAQDTARAATKHRVLLTDLKPSTVYQVRVASGGTSSRALSFSTEAPATENGKSALEIDLDPAAGNQKLRAKAGLKAGETVEMTVYASEVMNLSGFILDLDFDPDALSFVSASGATEGDRNLLSTGGGAAVFLSPVVQAGSLRFGGSILSSTTETVAGGDGLLGRFVFKTSASFGAGRETRVSLTRAVLKGLVATQQDTFHVTAAAALSSGETASGKVDPIVLDADPAPGDQGKRTIVALQPGATFDLEIVATSGANGATGFTVQVEFDPKGVAYVGFQEGDLIPALKGLSSPGDGVVELAGAMLGSGSGATTVAGSLGVLKFQLSEDATGTTALTLTSGSLRKGGQQEKFILRTVVNVIAGGGTAVQSSADFNGDGAVSFDDFFLFAAAFGSIKGGAGFDEKFDLDGSGSVDFSDFFLFAEAFGKSLRAGKAPAPEHF